jgi:hypothetical protein
MMQCPIPIELNSRDTSYLSIYRSDNGIFFFHSFILLSIISTVININWCNFMAYWSSFQFFDMRYDAHITKRGKMGRIYYAGPF